LIVFVLVLGIFQVVETAQAIPAAVADAANAVGENIAAAGHWVSLFMG
jgi:hypothetical protein